MRGWMRVREFLMDVYRSAAPAHLVQLVLQHRKLCGGQSLGEGDEECAFLHRNCTHMVDDKHNTNQPLIIQFHNTIDTVSTRMGDGRGVGVNLQGVR